MESRAIRQTAHHRLIAVSGLFARSCSSPGATLAIYYSNLPWAGLVGGRGIFIDACLIKATVDKKKRVPGDQPIAWPKAEEASRALAQLRARKVGICVSTVSIVCGPTGHLQGVGASQVDSCRRKRDMPDLRAVVLSRLRIHYR